MHVEEVGRGRACHPELPKRVGLWFVVLGVLFPYIQSEKVVRRLKVVNERDKAPSNRSPQFRMKSANKTFNGF